MKKDKNKNISMGRQTLLGITEDRGTPKPGLQTETRAEQFLKSDKNVIRTTPYSYQFIQGKGTSGDMKAENNGKRVEVCIQRRVLAATGDEFYTIAFFYPTGAVYYPYDCKFAECAEAQGWLDKMAELYKWKPFDPPLKLEGGRRL